MAIKSKTYSSYNIVGIIGLVQHPACFLKLLNVGLVDTLSLYFCQVGQHSPCSFILRLSLVHTASYSSSCMSSGVCHIDIVRLGSPAMQLHVSTVQYSAGYIQYVEDRLCSTYYYIYS